MARISDLTNLDQILKNKYKVPKNQRSFVWNTGNAQEFWDDLVEVHYAKGTLYLGSFILLENENENEDETLMIIDGQQRITTISILILAMYARLNSLNPEMARSVIGTIAVTDFVTNEEAEINEDTGEKPQKTARIPNLLPSESIRKVYDKMFEEEFDGTFKKIKNVGPNVTADKRIDAYMIRRVESIYVWFADRIKQTFLTSAEIYNLYKTLVNRVRVQELSVNDLSAAFDLFERTNDRGTPLEVSDLLKNLLFSKADPDEGGLSEEEIQNEWDLIVDAINPDDTKKTNNLGTMLQHYHLSFNEKCSKKDVFKKLKQIVNDQLLKKFLTNLKEFAIFYGLFFNGSKHDQQANITHKLLDLMGFGNGGTQFEWDCYQSLSALKTFGIKQVIPLVYAYFKAAKSIQDFDKKRIVIFLKALESYHFINNYVGQTLPGIYELKYQTLPKDFYMADNNISKFNIGERNLFAHQQKTLQSSIFLAAFKNLNYKDHRAKISFIFTRMAMETADTSEGKYLYLQGNWHLDHWLATNCKDKTLIEVNSSDNEGNPVDEGKPLDDINELDLIGNLLRVIGTDNQSWSAKTPKQKVEDKDKDKINICDSHKLSYVEDFIEIYNSDSWDSKKITKRTRDLANEALAIWQLNTQIQT